MYSDRENHTGVLCEHCLNTFRVFIEHLVHDVRRDGGLRRKDQHAPGYASDDILARQSSCYVCHRLTELAFRSKDITASIEWVKLTKNDGSNEVADCLDFTVSLSWGWTKHFRILNTKGQSD